MHGLRNHFVIVDGRNDPYRPTTEEIVSICDPHIGVGADQLVVIEGPQADGQKDGAVAFLRFYNVDGPEAEACGNATRCVGWLLLEELGTDEVKVQTRNGVLECRRIADKRVSCTMGRISMNWQDIPLSEKRDTCHLQVGGGPLRDAVALNIGNPHVVFFVDDTDAIDLRKLAPPIQQDALFPKQVNVGIAQMLSANRLRLKVFERGAGLTQACGSGACVAVFAALARGLTDERTVTVEMPAGEVEITISPDGKATMTGPVEFCFSGFLPPKMGPDTFS
ncbi:MAG: diaminopimelate epimerase [Gammaproteobacteria bacterium]|nr:diaminopimelate epimerase [Gammaproteobacteria bacterium]MDH4315326.1 diaminopimelate epimerase [Gammaproteobacteria bacterium]MDH5215147.1 diaminopimelate epimerase [Gammaproteobacteria bacterium]